MPYHRAVSGKKGLPDYRGPLGAAAWSGFVLTGDLRRSLKAAALRDCGVCRGAGFVGSGERVQACHCVNRRGETPI